MKLTTKYVVCVEHMVEIWSLLEHFLDSNTMESVNKL
jgi:hypothetical protein